MVTLEETIRYIIVNHLYHDEKVDNQTAVDYTIQDAEIDLGTAKHVLSKLPTDTYLNVQAIAEMFTHMHDSNQLIEEAISNHINLNKLGKIL